MTATLLLAALAQRKKILLRRFCAALASVSRTKDLRQTDYKTKTYMLHCGMTKASAREALFNFSAPPCMPKETISYNGIANEHLLRCISAIVFSSSAALPRHHYGKLIPAQFAGMTVP